MTDIPSPGQGPDARKEDSTPGSASGESVTSANDVTGTAQFEDEGAARTEAPGERGTHGEEEEKSLLSPPPLRTTDQLQSGEIAQTSEQQTWDTLVWTLIEQDDLAGAYWLARSLHASGLSSPAPHWLLAAVQGARWVEFGSVRFVNGLYEIAQKHRVSDSNEEQCLLSVAAALLPTLMPPGNALVDWLDTSVHHIPGLHEVIQAVSDFATKGIVLPRDAAVSLRDGATGDMGLETVIGQAKRWLKDAQKEAPV